MSIRKKPWNRVNLPVYSISSCNKNGQHNMHIITYAQAVSMQPKQFICAIYNNTKTLDNVQSNPHFILQLLANHQYNLVDLLGKKSGHNIDKMARLAKRNLLVEWNGFYILKDCLAVMEMKSTPLHFNTQEAENPDHQLWLCTVVNYTNLNEGEALSLDTLRSKKLIRI